MLIPGDQERDEKTKPPTTHGTPRQRLCPPYHNVILYFLQTVVKETSLLWTVFLSPPKKTCVSLVSLQTSLATLQKTLGSSHVVSGAVLSQSERRGYHGPNLFSTQQTRSQDGFRQTAGLLLSVSQVSIYSHRTRTFHTQ